MNIFRRIGFMFQKEKERFFFLFISHRWSYIMSWPLLLNVYIIIFYLLENFKQVRTLSFRYDSAWQKQITFRSTISCHWYTLMSAQHFVMCPTNLCVGRCRSEEEPHFVLLEVGFITTQRWGISLFKICWLYLYCEIPLFQSYI